ncbi:hypothetical protein [Chryseobacterium indoltheticum]|uniref:hypothetical protein n=1 Tax=Chryseobacterium indoltheticum TaxID=254 RepID=UPI003F494335
MTAAPQMTFSGSQYLELRYKSTTVDAIGVSSQNNSSVLGNVSLYRKSTINQPVSIFDISEWDSYSKQLLPEFRNIICFRNGISSWKRV